MTGRIALLLLGAFLPGQAQSVLTPTPAGAEQVRVADRYTISNSIETGYRFASVGGNHDVYRSSVNYGNGVRLFGSQLRVDAVDGNRRWLDSLSLNTQGAPGDPYQSTIFRAEKRQLYHYAAQYRTVDYVNRLPALWESEHGLRTRRMWQSHDVKLLPGRRVEILLGYDRNKRSGLGFSSEGIPDSVGNFDSTSFLRFATDVRQVNNQYRAGINVRVFGMVVTATQALDNFKEDTAFEDASALQGSLQNVQPVDSLSRSEPIHGNTHITQLAVRTERESWIGFQGRFAYSDGNRQSTLSESAVASGLGSASTVRQTFVFGGADRTQSSGEFTVTLLPSPKWTLTHTVATSNSRHDGAVDLLEVSVFTNELLRFEHLGIRHLSSSTEASYRPARQFSLYGVYRHARRRVRTSSLFPLFDFEIPLLGVDNKVNSGGGGVRWTPHRSVRASVDIEVGRADQPLAPVSNRRFHAERARIRWRSGALTASGFFTNEINNNPALLTNFNARRRSGGSQVSWVDPDGKITIDGGYSWLHADSSAGIFNLVNPGTAARTLYTSNLHTLNFSTRLRLPRGSTLYLGYTLAKDTGDGRDTSSTTGDFVPTFPSFSFDGANFLVSLPLTYQSPQVRLTIPITERLGWNVSWQFYSYDERFTTEQNYRAHVGYSSLSWSF